MDLLKALLCQLEQDGFGRLPEAEAPGDLFHSLMPQKPDACLCLYGLDLGVPGGEARVLALLRGPAGQAEPPLERAAALAACWEGWRGLLDGGCCAALRLEGGPRDLGPDGEGRHRWALYLRARYG